MYDDKIILKIIEQTGLSRKEIHERVKKKRKKFKGLTDFSALFRVVKDLCVTI